MSQNHKTSSTFASCYKYYTYTFTLKDENVPNAPVAFFQLTFNQVFSCRFSANQHKCSQTRAKTTELHLQPPSNNNY